MSREADGRPRSRLQQPSPPAAEGRFVRAVSHGPSATVSHGGFSRIPEEPDLGGGVGSSATSRRVKPIKTVSWARMQQPAPPSPPAHPAHPPSAGRLHSRAGLDAATARFRGGSGPLAAAVLAEEGGHQSRRPVGPEAGPAATSLSRKPSTPATSRSGSGGLALEAAAEGQGGVREGLSRGTSGGSCTGIVAAGGAAGGDGGSGRAGRVLRRSLVADLLSNHFLAMRRRSSSNGGSRAGDGDGKSEGGRGSAGGANRMSTESTELTLGGLAQPSSGQHARASQESAPAAATEAQRGSADAAAEPMSDATGPAEAATAATAPALVWADAPRSLADCPGAEAVRVELSRTALRFWRHAAHDGRLSGDLGCEVWVISSDDVGMGPLAADKDGVAGQPERVSSSARARERAGSGLHERAAASPRHGWGRAHRASSRKFPAASEGSRSAGGAAAGLRAASLVVLGLRRWRLGGGGSGLSRRQGSRSSTLPAATPSVPRSPRVRAEASGASPPPTPGQAERAQLGGS